MPRRGTTLRIACATVAVAMLAGAAGAQADPISVGVGRADITPPTGYYLMGWVRSDSVGRGQHTRLYARAIVLQHHSQKIALVAEDLNGIPGGMLQAAANEDKDLGFTEQNVLDSASHTHAAPSQYYNFGSYDTVFMTLGTPTQQNVSGSIDPQLYAFEVHQLAQAIRRANANLGPGRIGWGASTLSGVTQNRSLEAHLADFGIIEPFGAGAVSQDPGGYLDTIDPNVDVLRVDKLVSGPPASPAAHPRARPCAPKPRAKRKRKRRAAAKRRTAAGAAARRRPRHRHSNCPVRRPAKRRQAKRAHGAGAPAPRWMPVGMWSTFANHGTVNHYTFTYYNADHHGTAMRISEAQLRREGNVPASQDVVNAYGNSDAGDVTAGIAHVGPAEAEWVGRQESGAMLIAWRQAGLSMTSNPAFDERWTRVCFCGQLASGGAVDSSAIFGLAQLTGSEEGRGPLFDVTNVPFEGDTAPTDDPVQGDKIPSTRAPALNVPKAVPLMALRLGDRMIVSVPGEMTVEMGRRVRDAVLSAAGAGGVKRVVISGYANEYLSYFTTPEEYQRQHYEGASTLYGRYSSNLLEDNLLVLARRLVAGQAAPDPYPYDPTAGLTPAAAPFETGATSAAAGAQPQPTPRLGHAEFRWSGGQRGFDRPVDAAFVTIRRRVGASWLPVTDDLGEQILWSVDDNGAYRARWDVPLDAPAGSYEFVVTANHYRLESAPFDVGPSSSLTIGHAGTPGAGLALTLDYPKAVNEQDWTYRPLSADAGQMAATVNGQAVTVTGHNGVFSVPAHPGDHVTVAAGGAQDGFGNRNANALSLTA